jgi:hypothetical protein
MICASVIEEINRLTKPTKPEEEYRRQCVRTVCSTKNDEKVENVDSESPSCIEELWSVGKKLEWKRSGRLVQSFTGEGDILEAVWTTFMPSLNCIVIRETERLRIYAESGEEFLVRHCYLKILQ